MSKEFSEHIELIEMLEDNGIPKELGYTLAGILDARGVTIDAGAFNTTDITKELCGIIESYEGEFNKDLAIDIVDDYMFAFDIDSVHIEY